MPKARPTLFTVLQRTNFKLVLMAIALVSASNLVIGLFALRLHWGNTLQLVGQSISYTVEAALVFNDRAAAVDAVALIAADHDIEKVEVHDAAGRQFARWRHADAASGADVRPRIVALLLPEPVRTPVLHDGKAVGEICLYGRGDDLLSFLLKSLGMAGACFGLSAAIAWFVSRRAGRAIIEPLRELADVAHTARVERNFTRRVSSAPIAELQGLGDDFNALLAELQAWQARLTEENESLAYQAQHDPLTGLYNRSYFEQKLLTGIDSAQKSGGRLAVFFIDGDQFKAVNDRLGHEVGDQVLQLISARLRAHLRESDILARLGGDEFAVLLMPIRESAHATHIAENILASMKTPLHLPSGHVLHTSVSIGIAFFPDHAEEASELVKQADLAMYQAKKARPGTYGVAGMQAAPE